MKINYSDFMQEILHEPAKMANAYSNFYNYSSLNQWHAMIQTNGGEPINTYKGWQKLGRQVKKGAKAISLSMPVIIKEKNEKGEEKEKMIFIWKKNWFGLSQTEGEEFKQETPANFDLEKCLQNLEIKQENFQMVNGNCQGYAIPTQNTIAINPLAFDNFKTTIHELGHCLLHKESEMMQHDEELPTCLKEFEAEATAYLVKTSLGIFEGLEFSRGYIQNWLKRDQEVQEKNFKRVLGAVNKILIAGTK